MRVLRAALEVARALVATAERSRHALCGCSTIEQLGAQMGYGEEETRTLHLAGLALCAFPELEAKLLAGGLTVAAAETLGRLTRVPEMQPELASPERRAYWISNAQRLAGKRFRRLVQRKVAEARNRQATTTLVVPVTLDTEQDIDRARVIASRKARRPLSRGETIGETTGEAVRHYLDCFDPMRRVGGSRNGSLRNGSLRNGGLRSGGLRDGGLRSGGSCDEGRHCEGRRGEGRKPDPSFHPGTRKVPAGTQRLVRRRANDCCEYAGCSNEMFLQLAHLVPHSRGGDRSEDNIVLLCSRHHLMLDSGFLAFTGWGRNGPRFEVEVPGRRRQRRIPKRRTPARRIPAPRTGPG